jgi:hypothetical protein
VRLVFLFFPVIALSSCVSESEVYQRNLNPPQMSAYVRALPQAEREQIASVMAHRTSQLIVCMCEAIRPQYRGELYVYTAYPGAHERGGFGFFALKKISGAWRVIEGGTDLDPIMVCMICNSNKRERSNQPMKPRPQIE